MIFSNKIYKISSGKNISLFAEDENNIKMYLYKDFVFKKNISLNNSIRCEDLGKKLSYNKVIKINDNHSCICFDKNISVINNEEDF